MRTWSRHSTYKASSTGGTRHSVHTSPCTPARSTFRSHLIIKHLAKHYISPHQTLRFTTQYVWFHFAKPYILRQQGSSIPSPQNLYYKCKQNRLEQTSIQTDGQPHSKRPTNGRNQSFLTLSSPLVSTPFCALQVPLYADGSKERREQMPSPAHKLFPRRAPLLPCFGRKQKRLFLFPLKEVVKLSRYMRVYNDGILLTVPS